MIQGNMGLGNIGAHSASGPAKQDKPLTEQQTQLVSETLSQYEMEQLTQEDAVEIVEAFKEAGVTPGKALAEAMAQFEFDARSVGELAGIKGNETGPPPPLQSQPKKDSITSEMLDFLSEQLDKYGDGELSLENKESIMAAMQKEFSLQPGQHLLDEQA